MTQSDYQACARVLRGLRPEARDVQQWEDTVEAFVKRLKQGNPRFNSVKFRAECGISYDTHLRRTRDELAR